MAAAQHLSLNRRISRYFLILISSMTLIAVVSISLSNLTTISQSSSALFSSLLSSCSTSVENWLENASQTVERYGRLTQEEKLAVSSLADVRTAGVVSRTAGVMDAYYATQKDGRVYSILEDTEELFNSGYDARTRGWYKEAWAHPDRVAVSAPYVDYITKKMILTVSRQSGDGVAALDITTDALSAAVSSLSIPGDGFAVLTYGSDNSILAHKDPALADKKLAETDPALSADFAQGILQSSAQGEPGEVTLASGAKMLAMAVPITARGVSWKLFVFVSEDYFYSSFRQSMILFAAAVLIIALVSYLALKHAVSARIVAPLKQINRHLLSLSAGSVKLDSYVAINTGDEIESMSSSLTSFQKHQYECVQQLTAQVEENMLTSAEGSRTISDGISRQKKNVEEVLSLISELNDMTDKIQESTDQAVSSCDQMCGSTRKGLDLVTETEEAMRRLEASIGTTHEAVTGVARYTDEIASLSASIWTIAEQTNLLALNAAIESARAGEHGRGFAVVADEVRNLAVKTRESTEKIQSTVAALTGNMTSTLEKVQSSTQECQETGRKNAQTLQFISDVIARLEETGSQVRHITEFTRAQQDMLSSANGNIGKISSDQSDIEHSFSRITEQSRDAEENTRKIIAALMLN